MPPPPQGLNMYPVFFNPNNVPPPHFVYPPQQMVSPWPNPYPPVVPMSVQPQIKNPGHRHPGSARTAQPGRGKPNPRPRQIDQNYLTLTSLPSEKQRLWLGEHLFAQIQKVDAPRAGKITGMLLESEMSVDELYSLLLDQEFLQAKITEALRILQNSVTGNN